MSDWSPPTVPRPLLGAIALLYVLVLGYSFVIVQQPLIGVLLGLSLGVAYLSWRFLVALEGIADALQRMSRRGEQD